MRVDLALFENDELLARNEIRVGAEQIISRFPLFQAAHRLGEALPLSERLGQTLAIAQCLRAGACLAFAQGDADGAVLLFAAAHVVSPPPGGGEVPFEQDFAAALTEARGALGDQGARRAWTLGSGLPLAAAHERLVELLDRVSSPA